MTLVERKQRQARQRIVQAAEELFHARGFDDVSVTDIAQHAEVGRTTFFRHFGDKQEVVFAREQEMLDAMAEAGQADDEGPAHTAVEAVARLRPIVLGLCARIAADAEAYTRHCDLIERHPELRARDAVKMQMFAEKLSDLLVRHETERSVAVLAGQVALGCYLTAKRLGNDPLTLVDQTKKAFAQLIGE